MEIIVARFNPITITASDSVEAAALAQTLRAGLNTFDEPDRLDTFAVVRNDLVLSLLSALESALEGDGTGAGIALTSGETITQEIYEAEEEDKVDQAIDTLERAGVLERLEVGE